MTLGNHFDLELQDLLDGRLGDADAARVEAHVRECARCREELDVLRRGRHLARTGVVRADVPPDLLESVVARLDAAALSPRGFNAQRRRLLTYGVAAAAAGLATAIYVRRRHDIPAEAAESYVAYRRGEKSMDVTVGDPAALEQFFNTRLPFRTRVFDLAMMRYSLVGGRLDRIGGHSSAMYVYAGPDDRHLLCQMYSGTLSELPQPDERRTQNGISFQIYTRGPHTAVFWSEAAVTCVVVSDMPAADTVALAFAKAMKA